MIEMLMKPKRAERHPWELFFIGMFYSSVAFLMVTFIFKNDTVLQAGSGLLIVLITVLCILPFMYYLIKLEEGKELEINEPALLLKEHSKAIYALMWLFMGYVVAFSIWYIAFPAEAGANFNFQIKTFCAINSPANYDFCLESHGVPDVITGAASSKVNAFLSVFANNIYVLIFTLLFSLALGAGAIFILVWNASVIAAAVGIFARESFFNLPAALMRYMIHGVPEIAAYFMGALAGGIVSVAIIRKDLQGESLWKILEDALILIIASVIVLLVAAIMEVWLTPIFF